MNQFNILSPELHLYINNYLPRSEKITDIDEQLTNLALVSKSFTPVYYKETVAKIPAIKNLFKNPLSENLSVGSITNAYREQIEPYLMNFNLSKKELAQILDKLYIPVEEQIENLQSMNFTNKIELPNSDMSKYQVQRLIILSGSPLEKEQKEQLINIIDINDINDRRKITSLAAFCETKKSAEFLKTNFNILIDTDNKLRELAHIVSHIAGHSKEGDEYLSRHSNQFIAMDFDQIEELAHIASNSNTLNSEEGAKCLSRNFKKFINLDIEPLKQLSNFCFTKIGAKCLNTYFDKIIVLMQDNNAKFISFSLMCNTRVGAEFLYNNFDNCINDNDSIIGIAANVYGKRVYDDMEDMELEEKLGVEDIQNFQTNYDKLRKLDVNELEELDGISLTVEGIRHLNTYLALKD